MSDAVSQPTRRKIVAGSAAATAAMVAAPFVRTAYAAGKLEVGMWDHWVPGANAVTEKLIKEWAEKEKVDVKIDFITSQGQKLNLTAVAEAQAKAGHDVLYLGPGWPRARPSSSSRSTTSWPISSRRTATSRMSPSIWPGSRASGSRCRRPSAPR